MSSAISISGLRKTFGATVALDGLDLDVSTGEVHGFLGPNGAGKSTTIRVLLGLLRADAGDVRLLGGDPWRDAAALHRRLVYVPGEVNLWPNLTGGEVIDLLGRLRGGHDPKRRDALLERFDLDPTKKSRSYSKGNRQKVALVAALAAPMEEVELLLLDEPTSGPRPADGGGVPGLHPRGVVGRPHGAALQPHPGRGRGAVRPGQHRAQRPGRHARHAVRAAAPDPHDGGRRDPAATPTPCPPYRGWRTSTGSTAGSASTSTPTTSTRRCSYLASLGIRRLVSHPPTLEELFLRQYGRGAGMSTLAGTAGLVRLRGAPRPGADRRCGCWR